MYHQLSGEEDVLSTTLQRPIRSSHWRKLSFVAAAFAQRLQYEVSMGSLVVFGSTRGKHRDLSLASRHVTDALIAGYTVVLYGLPLVIAWMRQSKDEGWKIKAILKSGRSCATGGLLATVATIPVRVSVELFLCSLFFQSQSVALLALVYVAAAELYDETDSEARTRLWTLLFFSLNLGACCGFVASTLAIVETSRLTRWIVPAAQGVATLALAAALFSLDSVEQPAFDLLTNLEEDDGELLPHLVVAEDDAEKGENALSPPASIGVASFNELADDSLPPLTWNTSNATSVTGGRSGAYSEIRIVGSVLADASRRRAACAAPIAALAASVVGFGCNTIAWAVFANSVGAVHHGCDRGLFCRDGSRLSEIVFWLTTASCVLLAAAALVLLRSSQSAGYLEASKKQHGGKFHESDVEGAKDVVLLAPFVGLCMLYTALFTYALRVFAAQAESRGNSGENHHRSRDVVEAAVMNNFDSFIILCILPLVELWIRPVVENRTAPIRPLQKLVAASVLLVASLAAGTAASIAFDAGDSNRPRYAVQLPQYVLLAGAEIASIPTFYELFYSEVPPDLRVTSMTLYVFALAVGNLLGSTAGQIGTDPLECGAAALACAVLTATAWWLSAGRSYIYRQEREWVVAQQGRRLTSAAASQHGWSSPTSPLSTSSNRRTSTGETTGGSSDGEIVAVLRGIFTGLEAQYLIPFSLLKMGRLVASGGSGQVYKGRYAGFSVAIKSLFSQMMDPHYVSEVRHEARMLAAVRHPHITQFHGISRFENRLLLVTEFVPMSLESLVRSARKKSRQQLADNEERRRRRSSPQLFDSTPSACSDADLLESDSVTSRFDSPRVARRRQRRPDDFSVSDALRIWIELAQTLIYLHSTGLAHRDIKPSNMLLEKGRDRRYHLKLCDLGMARFSNRHHRPFVTMGAGTPAYSPPESYRPSASRRQRRSRGSDAQAADIDDLSKWDVFSFATVIWYTWHCKDPFPHMSVPEVCMAVTRGERPEFDSNYEAPPTIVNLVRNMWHQRPAERPDANEILAQLQSDQLTRDVLHVANKQTGADVATMLFP